MSELPHYYTSLAPFAQVFATGTPILTYHHLGKRTRGARLKGLYVSPELFRRQLTELRQAGFKAPLFDGVVSRGAGRGVDRQVFITFDDGFADIVENALPVLVQQQMCGIVFLVADLIGKTNTWQQAAGDVAEPLMTAANVKEWLAAGQTIGSHTKSHPWLTRVSATQAREEIQASRKALEDLFGVPVTHFCYPYGDWNQAVADLVREAGYRTACTTKAGVNRPEDSAFALKRFTARYRSRSLKNLWRFLRVNRGCFL